MPQDDQNQLLIDRIKEITALLKEGRFCEIDPASLDKNVSNQDIHHIAENFKQIIGSLTIACREMANDINDLPIITQHLTHISDTTEKGILEAINTAEAIMDETAQVKDALRHIHEYVSGNQELEQQFQLVSSKLDTVKDQCFSVITSLEFEDINRQVMEKIIERLQVLFENLLTAMEAMKLKERLETRDTAFLSRLKHIIDIEGANRQSQDMVDELFEDFSS